jgi:hypothetical protein
MIVAMQEKATEEQIDFVIEAMVEAGVGVHRSGWRGSDGDAGPDEV